MVDTRISALAALTGVNLATVDEFVFVDKSDTTMAASGTDKRMTAREVMNGLAQLSAFARPSKTGTYLQSAGGPNSSAQMGGDVLGFAPFIIPRACGFDRIGIRVNTAGTAGSVIRLGLYATDMSGWPNGAPLVETTVAGTATGFIEATISTATFDAGFYYAAAASQGSPATPPTCIRYDSSGFGVGPYDQDPSVNFGTGGYINGVTAALPSTPVFNVSSHPWLLRMRIV
jgi:hypothetical protein